LIIAQAISICFRTLPWRVPPSVADRRLGRRPGGAIEIIILV
jgi:hypothetical protein